MRPAARALLLLTALAGCSSQPPASKIIGVTLLTRGHLFYRDLEQGLQQEAARSGYRLVVTAAEFDLGKQAAQIEDFVAQKVSAILAAPCDSSAIVPQLAGAERAGIPVFTADIAAAGGTIVSHVASDNVQGGRLAAQALAQAIGDAGKVIVIDHPTVASVQDRVRGFEEEMKKHPNITIAGLFIASGFQGTITFPSFLGFNINGDMLIAGGTLVNSPTLSITGGDWPAVDCFHSRLLHNSLL